MATNVWPSSALPNTLTDKCISKCYFSSTNSKSKLNKNWIQNESNQHRSPSVSSTCFFQLPGRWCRPSPTAAVKVPTFSAAFRWFPLTAHISPVPRHCQRCVGNLQRQHRWRFLPAMVHGTLDIQPVDRHKLQCLTQTFHTHTMVKVQFKRWQSSYYSTSGQSWNSDDLY